jgi:hexosaminidase
MKKHFFSFCMACMLSSGTLMAQVANYDVVPLPKTVNPANAPGFVLNETVNVIYPNGNADMERNARFLSEYVSEMTQLRLASQPMPEKAKVKQVTQGNILLTLDPKVQEEEGYTIKVTATGVEISGQTPAGVFLGIQTLRKSLPVMQEKPQAVTLPAVSIADEPRFSYRGMHLDCARHFFTVDFVKEYIDLLALHGMNRFHWHLTDDQGWHIEIKKYPKLTEVGAWRSGTTVGKNSGVDDGVPYGGFYTQEECQEIVKYAADRYITIIPEIDMPGHMLAALASYPELGCTGGPYEVSHLWGIFPDVLCIGKENTFKFIEDVLDELVTIFPSEYIHIGGDECPRDRWAECPLCQQRIKDEGLVAQEGQSKEDLLQGYFTRRVEKFLHEKGKKLIGWDEILYCNVDRTSTIMSWRGAEPGAEAAKLGHDVIMTPHTHMYFDYYQTDKIDREPFSIGGNLPVKNVYAFEPVAAGLSAEDARHILGVQANLWTEYVAYPHHAEYMVLPRMAALAEVQWLQPGQKNYDAFIVRLKRLKEIYDLHQWTVAQHVFR